MIKAEHNPFVDRLFGTYLDLLFKLRFRKFIQPDLSAFRNKSILVLANHFSWWDGFFFHQIKKSSGHTLYVMMLESELRKHPFLKKLGAFSIQPGHRSMITSFQYAEDLLLQPNVMVVIFPQGRIESQSVPSISFAGGIQKFIDRLKKSCTIVFVNNRIEFGSFSKPSIISYHSSINSESINARSIEKSYQDFFNQSSLEHNERVRDGIF
jgi:hypothetical protein